MISFYRSVETNKVWVRPLKTFMSEVDKTEYPNTKQQYQFERVTAEDALWIVSYEKNKGILYQMENEL